MAKSPPLLTLPAAPRSFWGLMLGGGARRGVLSSVLCQHGHLVSYPPTRVKDAVQGV